MTRSLILLAVAGVVAGLWRAATRLFTVDDFRAAWQLTEEDFGLE